MSTELLVREFERLTETPDSVDSLRKFIVDLATRGRLIRQEQRDGNAAQLLSAIDRHRTSASAHQRMDKNRKAPVTASHGLPATWKWANLADVCGSITDGDHQPPPKSQSGIPLLVIGNVRFGKVDFRDSRFVPDEYYALLDDAHRPRAGDVLYTLVGSYGIAIAVENDNPFCVQRHIAILRPEPEIAQMYLRLALNDSFSFEQATNYATGIAQKTVPLRGLRQLSLPIPPLAEQHRIVAGVDELMALLDELEADQRERERRRDALRKSTLQRLTASDGLNDVSVQKNVRFFLVQSPRLLTKPEHIAEIQRSILDLAVQGRLVPQDGADEPHRCRRLAAADHADNASMSPMLPFSVPSTWATVQVRQTLEPHRDISYGVIKLGPEPKGGGIPTLRCSDVKLRWLDLTSVRTVDPAIEGEYARTRLKGGEIVINVRGTLGGVARVPTAIAGFNVAREVAVVPVAEDLDADFLVNVMASSYFWDLIQESLRGIAYVGLNLRTLRELPVPVPPIAEQNRIVAKVDELMAVCDELKTALASAQTERARLLDTVLHQTLAGGAEMPAAASA